MTFEQDANLIQGGRCSDCGGRGVDRRNRKRKCPGCHGSGQKAICAVCGHDWPCPEHAECP